MWSFYNYIAHMISLMVEKNKYIPVHTQRWEDHNSMELDLIWF